jgi:hypothetical protein
MVRFLSANYPKKFWNEDKGLTSIFILLCVNNFLIVPFFEHGPLIHLLSRIIWLILIVAGITALAESKKLMRHLFIIPILLVSVNILQFIHDNQILNYVEFVLKLAVSALLIVMVLIKVFEAGSVTVHRVIGSILAYMLIGNLWADLFEFIYLNTTGAIQFPAADVQAGISSSTYLYFSYTTLTTTGFGEILPLNSMARTLVTVEQLVGVLYPVVLIGRLVSLVTGDSTAKPDQNN